MQLLDDLASSLSAGRGKREHHGVDVVLLEEFADRLGMSDSDAANIPSGESAVVIDKALDQNRSVLAEHRGEPDPGLTCPVDQDSSLLKACRTAERPLEEVPAGQSNPGQSQNRPHPEWQKDKS